MYLTALLWVIFSIVFAAIFYRKAKSQFVIKVEVDTSDYESPEYQIHDDPGATKTTTA
jgi:hypothetical protein